MRTHPTDPRTTVRPPTLVGGRLVLAARTAFRLAGAAILLVVVACGVGETITGAPRGPLVGGGGGTGVTGRPVPSFSQVTAGDVHSCALTQNNVAWCWGGNGQGQLGRGTTGTSGGPDTVRAGSTSFLQLSAGGAHTCGIDGNGVAWCWGSNATGQLGVGTTDARVTTPTRVSGSRSWLAISAGATHTCGIAESGAAFCWGSNVDGQLGTGVAGDSPVPVAVAGLSAVTGIAAGDGFTCAVRQTGTGSCWGREGALGAAGASATPRDVGGTASLGGLDAGANAACALEPAVLRALCWGDPDVVGSDAAGGTVPGRVTLDVDLRLVSVGGTSACALTTTGLARCWGDNGLGQLGAGTTVAASVLPVPVAGDSLYRALSVGGAHACAITERLETFCWGSNAFGQLGRPAGTAPVRSPARVP